MDGSLMQEASQLNGSPVQPLSQVSGASVQAAAPQLCQIVANWLRLIKLSGESEHRKGFMKTARMCTHFYCGAMGFMWSDDFRREFLNGLPAPDFKITIAKAFEM